MRLILAVGLLTAGTMFANIIDNFESYPVGAFPSPTWLDVGTVNPPPGGQSIPSATVVSTTDAFGNPTQALGLVDQVAFSRGIYAPVAVNATYDLAADIRVDRYSNSPQQPPDDWAMQLTFAEVGPQNFAFTNQAGIYASSLTKTWRLFLIGGPGADIDLGAAVNIGTWYRVQLEFDALTDTFHSRINDVFTGNTLVDQFNTIAGLTPADTQYDSIAFFGGETSPFTTVADQAVVDNVNISATPEPTAVVLVATVMALLALRFRKHARNS
jgi:hypothetical protein